MIPELKHINHTLQSLNSSIKVMHLLENQENNQNILQDSPAMFVCFALKEICTVFPFLALYSLKLHSS